MPRSEDPFSHETFLRLAIAEAIRGVKAGEGGPFGAIVVKDGAVIGRGSNQVTSTLDPTAHAEVQAIRAACQRLGTFQLEGCDVYASCEPCPMCLGALYWARPRAIYYAAERGDAAAAGFDDAFIYEELARPPGERRIPLVHTRVPEQGEPFAAWNTHVGRIPY
jgi:tRNA(Arg) A34 adenosine deaminase TadA